MKKVNIALSGGQASNLVMILKERIRKIEREQLKCASQGRPFHPVAVKTLKRCHTSLNLLLSAWKGQTNEELLSPGNYQDES